VGEREGPRRSFVDPDRVVRILLVVGIGGAASLVLLRGADFITVFAAVVAGLLVLLPEQTMLLMKRFQATCAAGLRRPSATTLLWGVVLLGVLLRLRAFLVERALWLDEAYLARSFLGRDLGELLRLPLEHAQSAPPGFLGMTYAAVKTFGFSELSLRIVPFLAAVGVVVLSVPLARRSLRTRWAQAFFVALMSTSPFLIYY